VFQREQTKAAFLKRVKKDEPHSPLLSVSSFISAELQMIPVLAVPIACFDAGVV
jgi:hypothetical protein